MFLTDKQTLPLQRCLVDTPDFPQPGCNEEKAMFKELQGKLSTQFRDIFPNRLSPKTIVVIPSLTLDREILDKVKGHIYYEERMLCLLMLLRMPQTNIIFVSSLQIDQVIIDYYLHLLPGITGLHAKRRLSMLSCYDASAKPLTQKILERPRLIEQIRSRISDTDHTHLVCFNVAEQERTLAVHLKIPIYGCDPDLLYLGSKTGSRMLFKKCGMNIPEGSENLHTLEDVKQALYDLRLTRPSLKKAVIKINEGFSGEGNAVFTYPMACCGQELKEEISMLLPGMRIVADNINYHQFFYKFSLLGGIVEEFLEGEVKASPSVQCRVNPLGEVEIISTHDQILEGQDSQVFVGASFPADLAYAVVIGNMAAEVASAMGDFGVLGRFSIDFLSVYEGNDWKHYALEINLRKGGTTHPFLMLQFLTDGIYNAADATYLMPNGHHRFYFASDNVSSPAFIGLSPSDLIDIAIFHGLMYDSTTQQGVMFHLMGALSQYGKTGMVCIAGTPEKAKLLYDRTIDILKSECIQKVFN